jgi:hypothetical protein
MNEERKVLGVKISPLAKYRIKVLREKAKKDAGRNVTYTEVLEKLINEEYEKTHVNEN